MGGICPIQHYCPSGTSQPLTCQDGYIQRKVGKSYCDPCPSGYTCKAGLQEKCPEYKICVTAESFSHPYAKTCKSGFYLKQRERGKASHNECIPCPESKFCIASRIVDDCAPGYVCFTEADEHTPNIPNKAYPCPLGYYCNEGASSPVLCPIGTFTNDTAAKQVSECTICSPGKYCNYESRIPQGCPPGAYCPIGSQFPTLCPRGTFQPNNNQSGIDDCKPCMGGYFCNETGLGNLFKYGEKYKCPLGHYCPTGTSVKPIACLAGTFIDENSVDSSKSGSGFLADSLNDCNYCPEHFYCERGTKYRYEFKCKNGFICPLGSGDMIPCPAGQYCVFSDEE
jgi:hypothetical protein